MGRRVAIVVTALCLVGILLVIASRTSGSTTAALTVSMGVVAVLSGLLLYWTERRR